MHYSSFVDLCLVTELWQVLLKHQFEQLTHQLALHNLIEFDVIRAFIFAFARADELLDRKFVAGKCVLQSIGAEIDVHLLRAVEIET